MNQLTIDDRADLNRYEIIIKTGLNTFIEVGNALLQIKEKKLYRENYNTFEDYCQERWQMSKTHANRLIQSNEIISNLTPMGVILPTSERQIRELSKLEPELQRWIWKNLNEVSEKITAKTIKNEVQNHEALNEKIKEVKTEQPEIREDSEIIRLAQEKELLESENSSLQSAIFSINQDLTNKDKEIKDLKAKTEQQSKIHLSLQEKLKSFSELEKEKKEAEKKLLEFAEWKNKNSQAFYDQENFEKIFNELQPAIEYFQKHLFWLPSVQVSDGSKKALNKQLSELIELIDQWSLLMKQKFIIKELSEV